jgi:hypothetical protein
MGDFKIKIPVMGTTGCNLNTGRRGYGYGFNFKGWIFKIRNSPKAGIYYK